MVAHLSYPFRVLPTGDIATVEADTDAAYAEELAVILLTRRGERPLVPGYGTNDPVGSGVDAADLAANSDVYGPPVRILSVSGEAISPTVETVSVAFEREGE